MSKIKIMTDSASDIPFDKEKELDIHVLNFPVVVEGKGYHERADFTYEKFYDILENCDQIPSHSQINPIEFSEVYRKYYDEGITDLIYVSINSKGSATYSNAVSSREQFYSQYPEAKETYNIHIIDSKTYSALYGYAVVEAAEKAKKGSSVNEIIAFIEDWVKSVRIYFVTYDLKFAKKSGRISAAAAFVGELMGLKPMLTFEDGESLILKKIRGEKAVIPEIIKMAKENMVPNTPYLILSGNRPDKTEELRKDAKKAIGYEAAGQYLIGPTISINSGPQIVALIIKKII